MRKLKPYNSIFEFRKDYPSKEKREIFLQELSNEEIDELIDLCDNVEEKNHFQSFKRMETVFGYCLEDTSIIPIHCLKIVDDASGSFVEYAMGLQSLHIFLSDTEIADPKVRIDRETLKQIRRILDHEELFETAELETSREIMVLDGYQQIFEISSKGRHIKASGSNIQVCRNEKEHCPHSVAMITLLDEIRRILVPLGIPEDYFKLD